MYSHTPQSVDSLALLKLATQIGKRSPQRDLITEYLDILHFGLYLHDHPCETAALALTIALGGVALTVL